MSLHLERSARGGTKHLDVRTCDPIDPFRWKQFFSEITLTQMRRMYGLFSYMKGENWPHEQGEMAW